MSYPYDDPDHDNNIVATGGVLALLVTSVSSSLKTVEAVVDAKGEPTNQIDLSLSFLKSAYRLTIEKLPDS